MNGMSQRSDQQYTQNGFETGKPWELDATYGKEPSANGPYASAAENPFWPVRGIWIWACAARLP